MSGGQAQSTIKYTYDLGNRLTQVVDSASGTLGQSFNGLNELTSQTTPQGTVADTYNADGLPVTLTVNAQAPVTYSYDTDGELTGEKQGLKTWRSVTTPMASRQALLSLTASTRCSPMTRPARSAL